MLYHDAAVMSLRLAVERSRDVSVSAHSNNVALRAGL